MVTMKKSTIIGSLILTVLMFSACTQQSATSKIVEGFIAGSEKSANLQEYSEEILTNELENERRVLLFFHANWCPTCRVLENDLTENISDLPKDLTILKIDFDSQKELKEKHKIIIQHSLIQLDQNGKEITRWIGGGIPLLLQELK